MLDFIRRLFESDFLPHGHCYFWQPAVVWLHVISDGLIALSYYSIPIALLSFLKKRRDLPYRWMFLMFGGFILACGTTHLMSVVTLWIPVYRVDGVVKLVTAGLSLATAAMLWPVIPRAVTLPSPGQLEQANRALHAEIAERRRVEVEIRRLNVDLERHATRVEAANRELEAFSYSVSHDLRAPLRSIDGFSQAILEDCGSVLDARGREHLDRVRGAAQRMSQLVDDLLTLSRLSRAEMEITPVDLSRLALEITEELAKREPGRRVEIRAAHGLVVPGDARLLRIALENLLANAWKFTRKRDPARIEIGGERRDRDWILFVRDNGAGFDMTHADRLFGAFQRLHSADEFEGTGIGLATVARIVIRHGGTVRAEGQVDRGATFFITLPDL